MTLPRWNGPRLKIQKSDIIGSLPFRDPSGQMFVCVDINRVDGEAIVRDVTLMLAGSFQKAATKPIVAIQGVPITIDRPKGFVQTGVDHLGVPWTRTYQVDYGYIRRTQGGDGENLDVYCGDTPDAPDTFWVYQIKADGSFDEYKVLIGYASAEHALACYRAHTPDWCFGYMFSVPMAGIKALLNLPPDPMIKVSKEDMVAPAPGEPGSIEPSNGIPKKKPRHFNQKLLKAARQIQILKEEAPTEEGFVLGIVLVPEEPDLQDDIYSEEEIRWACHDYMAEYRNIGDQHKTIISQGAEFQGGNDPVTIVENYCAPADFMVGEHLVKKGTWLMGARINDLTYRDQVKSGAKTGFSIGGDALRSPEV